MIKIQLFLFKSLWRLNLSRKSINIFIFGIFLLNCCYGLYSNGARGRMGEMRRFKTWTSSEVNSVMWEYKKAFVWLWKSNSERISLDKRRKQKLTLGKQIIQKRNNSILNKKCSWIEPLDTFALFGFESISQALYPKFEQLKEGERWREYGRTSWCAQSWAYNALFNGWKR